MKKIILTLAGSVLVGLSALQAQQNDTTGSASRADRQLYERGRGGRDRMTRDEARRQQRYKSDRGRYGDRDRDANEGMVIIRKDEIPASLRKTLQDEKYAGWENGTVYHNTNTGEYVIAPRAFRFNKKGEEISMDGAPMYPESMNPREGGVGDRARDTSDDRSGYSERDRPGQVQRGETDRQDRRDQPPAAGYANPGERDSTGSHAEQQPSNGYRDRERQQRDEQAPSRSYRDREQNNTPDTTGQASPSRRHDHTNPDGEHH